MALKAEISSCPNKRMAGRELRRLRNHPDGKGLSQRQVGVLLGKYRVQIQRWEELHEVEFELHPMIMQQLLSILGASSL